jgi:V8-like Glu-specific endopeptidase
MADTDVVEQELKVLRHAAPTDWSEFTEPVPFPHGGIRSSAQTAPGPFVAPVSTLVTDEERVTAPYRSVGRMALVTGRGAKKATASGWVVSRRAFITAGHCAFLHHDSFGGWISQAVFVPRYHRGVGAEFTVKTIYALKGWVESGKFAFDMAACVVTENFADTEPPLPFSMSIIPAVHNTAIGYPVRPVPGYDFNGERMWKSVGKLIDLKEYEAHAANNLTEGASGGPWCDNDARYEVAGITSNRPVDPHIALSPIFDHCFKNLYDAVKNL